MLDFGCEPRAGRICISGHVGAVLRHLPPGGLRHRFRFCEGDQVGPQLVRWPTFPAPSRSQLRVEVLRGRIADNQGTTRAVCEVALSENSCDQTEEEFPDSGWQPLEAVASLRDYGDWCTEYLQTSICRQTTNRPARSTECLPMKNAGRLQMSLWSSSWLT